MSKTPSRREVIEQSFSDVEVSALKLFADNEITREAVRKLLLYGITQQGAFEKGKPVDPTRNFALGIVQLAEQQGLGHDAVGKRMTAVFEGVQFLESAFQEIDLFKTIHEEEETKGNPAR